MQLTTVGGAPGRPCPPNHHAPSFVVPAHARQHPALSNLNSAAFKSSCAERETGTRLTIQMSDPQVTSALKLRVSAAAAPVEHHARMFLEGKVDYAVRNFGSLLGKLNPRSKNAAEVKRAIGYFRHNRDRMRYDEYLAQGYPIGSGAAEGTCRNLVKDRLELSGMKWEHTGAQAMIYLRAIYLNDDWAPFINYRIQKEQKQLYGERTIYGKLAPYGQAA